MPVRFSIHESGSTGRNFVLTVIGDLDAGSARELERRLRVETPDRRASLVVDLTQVDEVDRSCVDLVARRSLELAGTGQQIRVIAREGPVRDAFHTAGLGYLVGVDRRTVARA
jgi:anti-anti-sigma factor